MVQQFFLLTLLGKRTKHEYIVLGRLHQARLQRQAQMRVRDNTQQRAAPRQSAAVRQQGIVGGDSPHPDHDRVVFMTELLYVSPGCLTGDPSAGAASRTWRLRQTGIGGRWRDLAVE